MPNTAQLLDENGGRLRKMLALSRSSNDQEALIALRKSESLMARYGLSLDDLVVQLESSTSELASSTQRLKRLELLLELERGRARDISNALKGRSAKDLEAGEDRTPNHTKRFNSLVDLKHYLMQYCDLKAYERKLLEPIAEVRPRSKEAHLVLICANRYGIRLTQ